MKITISELYFFPIKSFRGFKVSELKIDADGPRYDRQWMLVDENDKFITQRQMPQLAKISVHMEEDAFIELSQDGYDSVDFGLEEQEEEELQVKIWDDEVPAYEVNTEVSEWLSKVLKKKVRLVRLSPEAKRAFGEDSEQSVRFVDQKPLLVVSEASLKQLEAKSQQTLSMLRFRPNIVVTGSEAHSEDQWKSFQVKSLEFKALKACTRCKITTLQPLTGEAGEEPLKTLATYRKGPKGLEFGYYYAHNKEGVLRVGDVVSPIV